MQELADKNTTRNAPLVIILKMDGDWRQTADFRELEN